MRTAATGCGALIYSRAGYGRSDPVSLPRPLDYQVGEAITVLPRILETTGIRRAVLVGHSDGATIALLHAGRVRDPRVGGLVLMAPHVFNEPVCIAGIRAISESWRTGGLRERLRRLHGANVDVAFEGWRDAWLTPIAATTPPQRIQADWTTMNSEVNRRTEDGTAVKTYLGALGEQVRALRARQLMNSGKPVEACVAELAAFAEHGLTGAV